MKTGVNLYKPHSLRIGLVLETSGGGAGRHVIDLARELVCRKHDVVVFYSPVRAESSFITEIKATMAKVVPVVMHREPGWRDLKSLVMLNSAIKMHGPFDIVHGHSSKAGALVRIVRAGSAKIVYTPHAFRGLEQGARRPTKALFDFIESMLGKAKTDAIIAVSNEELAFAYKLGIPPKICHLIYNGVIHPHKSDYSEVRAELGLRSTDIVVAFVGRLCHQKAPERFLQAVAEIMPKHPELKALVIGGGDLTDKIAAQIAKFEYPERFLQLGPRSAEKYLSAVNLIMMTSRYEGLSYVMLEALIAHLPIITTDVAGARDVVEDGVNGVIVRNGDQSIAPLAKSLDELVENPLRRAAMAEAAGRRSKVFNGQRMIDETESLYHALVTKKTT
jgi:glycosyltransferase involved in cell wall biosynthesis